MGPCVELRSVLCRSSHSITVQAADPSGAFTTQTFTIAVTDQAPSTPTDSDGATGGSVSEGASNGATVGITAASTDVNGGTVGRSHARTPGTDQASIPSSALVNKTDGAHIHLD